RRHEGLNLEQNRTGALERAGDRCTHLPFRAPSEQLRGLGDADEAGAGHLEHSELVRRPEAVLRRPQNSVRVVAVALELEHAVDGPLALQRRADRFELRLREDLDVPGAAETGGA